MISGSCSPVTCKTNFIVCHSYPVVNPTITRIPTRAIGFPSSTGGRKWHRFTANAASLELPLLPFNVDEVLVPSECKKLHLYEARYLALLEESLSRKNKLFVHFVLEPISISEVSTEVSFAARYECLVLIENVERLEVGALVSIRGIGRVKIVKFVQAEPYLKGVVTPVQDMITDNLNVMSSKLEDLKGALRSLNSLEIKLKTPKEELLQTRTANSLTWAEREPPVDCHEDFIPRLAERVSFAPFQQVSGSSQSELLKLKKEKLKAMELKDTLRRLNDSLDLVKENASVVTAKLALQSLHKQ